MNLNEYQWSGNPRGIHHDFHTRQVDVDFLASLGMGWVKLVTIGGPEAQIDNLHAHGITSIARIYRAQPGNSAPSEEIMKNYGEYLAAGCKWFELYNEPNLAEEWAPGSNFDPYNQAVIGPMMTNWLNWAEFIINGGGYPGLPALAEADGKWEYNGYWIDSMLNYLYENHFDRFRNILNSGCYVATHPGVLNHFYQEEPGGGSLSARPPERQNMNEGGWHFEYPYDPINQREKPGTGVWSKPKGEIIGLIASGVAFMERLSQMFGVGAIPVVGTEGGIFLPFDVNRPMSWDHRYPPYTWQSHAHATLAMFDWIIHTAPPWLFGVTLWTSSEYFNHSSGEKPPVLEFFRNRPPGYKTVPPLSALGSLVAGPVAPTPVTPTPLPSPGPGPVHGTPTYHFIYLAPEINPDWFFDGAKAYWERFLPTLLDNLEYINNLTYDVSLGLTVICAPDQADAINQQTAGRWQNLWLDKVIVTSAEELAQRLNDRAQSGLRFG